MYEKNIHIFSSGQWVKSIENHYWWSISKATSPKELVERFRSILFHIVNRHSWPGCEIFQRCEHATLQRKTKWMDPEDTAYQEIRKIITTKQLQNDLLQIGEVVHTTLLEV
jgi:hypothetical protein